MNIPGVGSLWVPVEFVYTTGPEDAFLMGTCVDGDTVYGIYGLGSCACINADTTGTSLRETNFVRQEIELATDPLSPRFHEPAIENPADLNRKTSLGARS
jgi:hypothetical protein